MREMDSKDASEYREEGRSGRGRGGGGEGRGGEGRGRREGKSDKKGEMSGEKIVR